MLKSKIVFTIVLSTILLLITIVNTFAAQYSPPWAHLHYIDSTVKLSWADGWVDQMGYNSYSVNSLSSYSAYNYWKSDAIFIFNGHGLVGGGGIELGDHPNWADQHWIFADERIRTNEQNGENGGRWYWINLMNNEINDTLVSMYIGCETSLTDGQYGNLLSSSRGQGTDVAIGWPNDLSAIPSSVFGMGFLRGAWANNYKIDDPVGYHSTDIDLTTYAYKYMLANDDSPPEDHGPLSEFVTQGQYGQRLQPARYGTP